MCSRPSNHTVCPPHFRNSSKGWENDPKYIPFWEQRWNIQEERSILFPSSSYERIHFWSCWWPPLLLAWRETMQSRTKEDQHAHVRTHDEGAEIMQCWKMDKEQVYWSHQFSIRYTSYNQWLLGILVVNNSYWGIYFFVIISLSRWTASCLATTSFCSKLFILFPINIFFSAFVC